MDNMNKLIENLIRNNQLLLEDIPEIDLYMDQVIQLFEKKFASNKRNNDEKVLTKTMINNYAKGKLFHPVKNKKYTKDHLIMISMIYQLKGTLSINDIKVTMDKLNNKVEEESFNLDNLYKSYIRLADENTKRFTQYIQEIADEVNEKVQKLEDDDQDYLEQLLLIASLVNMSNLFRKIAERLVDEINKEDEA